MTKYKTKDDFYLSPLNFIGMIGTFIIVSAFLIESEIGFHTGFMLVSVTLTIQKAEQTIAWRTWIVDVLLLPYVAIARHINEAGKKTS